MVDVTRGGEGGGVNQQKGGGEVEALRATQQLCMDMLKTSFVGVLNMI